MYRFGCVCVFMVVYVRLVLVRQRLQSHKGVLFISGFQRRGRAESLDLRRNPSEAASVSSAHAPPLRVTTCDSSGESDASGAEDGGKSTEPINRNSSSSNANGVSHLPPGKRKCERKEKWYLLKQKKRRKID